MYRLVGPSLWTPASHIDKHRLPRYTQCKTTIAGVMPKFVRGYDGTDAKKAAEVWDPVPYEAQDTGHTSSEIISK